MKTDKTERQTKALTLFMARFVVKCYTSRCNSWGRPGSGVLPKKKKKKKKKKNNNNLGITGANKSIFMF